MSHVHTFFIHMFFSYLLWTCVSFCSFLRSLLNRTSLWHPNRRNPFQLETLVVVLGHPLLLFLLFHLIFGSMMRMPRWTSLRTSRNVVFIRNARLFCWILLTLLYLKSFGLEIGNLYLRDPRGVPSCLFRSFTPTYMTSIPLCLSLFLHSEVYVS